MIDTILAPDSIKHMTTPRVIMPIEHIDGESVSEHDRFLISQIPCLNCLLVYDAALPVYFVRTNQGIFWWHRHRCAAYEL